MPQTATAQPSAVVVHLSDLHFSHGDAGLEERNALIRERLCADLAPLLAEDIGAKADAVVVTGDIAYAGTQPEYKAATRWIESDIFPIANGPTRLLCVPGNHDVDWTRIGPTHEAHRTVLGSCAEEALDALLDRYLTEPGQAILNPLSDYNEFAASVDCQIEDRYCWDAPLVIGGGYELDFRGVTTVVNSYKDDQPGGLAVHANQLLYSPEPGRIPILLAHHDTYFWRRHHRLDGDVTKRMSLALYGHTHTPRLRQVEQCVEITGGAVQPDEGKDWMPAYNVIQLDVLPADGPAAPLRVRVWRRRFSTDHDRFVPDVASGTYEERTVSIHAAAPSGLVEVDHEDHEETRVALTTPEGGPHPIREVQRLLYGLGVGQRITLLDRIGIDVSDLARLPPHRLIPAAAAAIIDQGKLDVFRAAIDEIPLPASGGDDA